MISYLSPIKKRKSESLITFNYTCKCPVGYVCSLAVDDPESWIYMSVSNSRRIHCISANKLGMVASHHFFSQVKVNSEPDLVRYISLYFVGIRTTMEWKLFRRMVKRKYSTENAETTHIIV